MRTTLNIDDDLLAAVKCLSDSQSVPIGKVVSDLMRRAMQTTTRIDTDDELFPTFKVSPNSRPITPEDVRRIEDEL